jgi:hypothetical protein
MANMSACITLEGIAEVVPCYFDEYDCGGGYYTITESDQCCKEGGYSYKMSGGRCYTW